MRSSRRSFGLAALAFLVIASFSGQSLCGDWPMWRYDAGRTANASAALPDALHPQWTRQFSPRVQVWDDPLNQDLMPYDRIFEPIVLGETMFIGFNDSDKLAAIDIRSGETRWEFFADGPVRLPAAAWKGKVYFCGDDGFLYCLNASNGREIWKFQGGPSDRKLLGNERVISTWPARGGPVIRDGTVYFTAGIWPFMGTFIYALNAESGRVEWVNDGTGSQYILQPHSAASFGGLAPQGALAATEKILLIPGGRSVPAGFDRATGEQLYFHLNDGGKGNGGSLVMANASQFFVHTRVRGVRAYDLKSGRKTKFTLNEPVLDGEVLYAAREASVRKALMEDAKDEWDSAKDDVSKIRKRVDRLKEKLDEEETSEDLDKAIAELSKAEAKASEREAGFMESEATWKNGWQGRVVAGYDADRKQIWEVEADGLGDLIKAGGRLYAAGRDAITVLELNSEKENASPSILQTIPANGSIVRLLAANGMLFGVSLDGKILAFGEEEREPKRIRRQREEIRLSSVASAKAERLLKHVNSNAGYAVCFGLEDGALLEALIKQSDFHFIGVDPDASRVNRLRKRFDRAGWYGKRAAIHRGDPQTFAPPQYIAHLIVVDRSMALSLSDEDALKTLYDSVRPYGGVLWVDCDSRRQTEVSDLIAVAGLPNSRVERHDDGLLVIKEGALPGSADWTHQYGDIANTVKSNDKRVEAPLGVLWFGGNSNTDVLPRHGHGPPEQVVGGRLYIEGMNSISARDVYTGRVLWKTSFEDMGTHGIYFDDTYKDTPLDTSYNQVHIPGANGRGTNFIATEETIYVVIGNACHLIDARTGEPRDKFIMPHRDGVERDWGFVGVYGDLLLGGAGFANLSKKYGDPDKTPKSTIEDFSASDGLTAFDRRTGEVMWEAPAYYHFLHNGIIAGNGLLYCLDKLPKTAEEKLKRRGRDLPGDYRVIALDPKSGEKVWEFKGDVFGTWLSYSQEHDIVLQAGASASDRLDDEAGQGMLALRGATGEVIWKDLNRRYSGPCILHHELIIANADQNSYREREDESSTVFNLLDGAPLTIENPVTGVREPWRITRGKGCNSIIGCENFLTFRDGAASYYDLKTKTGLGHFGGFRSSCTSNLIVANGVLNAPDYTRTCSCAYQNQTSLALVHMPEVEVWKTGLVGVGSKVRDRIERIGINLGAPGDRLADDGTLWIEHPSVGGASPNLVIETTGERVAEFRNHTSRLEGEGWSWVNASGMSGIEKLSVAMTTWKEIAVNADSGDATEASDGKVHLDDKSLALGESKDSAWTGVRFDDVYLNPDETVAEARIRFVPHESSDEDAEWIIRAELAANAAAFNKKSEDLSKRALTEAYVTWKPEPWKKGEAAAATTTPNLSPLIQEVVQQQDWRAGNALVFLIQGSGKREVVSYRSDYARAPRLSVDLNPHAPGHNPPALAKSPFTVRLFFSEPEALHAGERIFQVILQGAVVLDNFDVFKEAGGMNRGVVKEFKGVLIGDSLDLSFARRDGAARGSILSGIELIAEEREFTSNR